MNKSQRCYALILAAQRHWRYSKDCKRADYHRMKQKECQQQAAQLQDELRRERSHKPTRLEGLYQ